MKTFLAAIPLFLLFLAVSCAQGSTTSNAEDVGRDAIQSDMPGDPGTPGDTADDASPDTTGTDAMPDGAIPDGVQPDTSATDAATDISANDTDDGDTPPDDDIPNTGECPEPLTLSCGDTFNHNTGSDGRPNLWGAYSCTARALSGPEAIYLLKTSEHVKVTVTLTNLTTDLDVARLSRCDPFSCNVIASTPFDIQDDEQIQFDSHIGSKHYIVVDGYNGATGPYTINVSCEPIPEPECPPYLSRLAECPFIWGDPVSGSGASSCPSTSDCLGVPCAQDGFCGMYAETGGGELCVMGNCVYCWQDSQCPDDNVCRAGRCVEPITTQCPDVPDCSTAGCTEVRLSDTNCPACVCDTLIFHQCEVDQDCLPYSHHRYSRCVFGRCTECRLDDDCDSGECLPPGICYSMSTHPSAIFGSWLIGWYGGLDHFSYFRFEPDGTMRRAGYIPAGSFTDDILAGGCTPAEGQAIPGIVGTWEPEITESGFLVIRIAFVSPCQAGQKVSERFVITMGEDDESMTLSSVENPDAGNLIGLRRDPSVCSADFTICTVWTPYSRALTFH